VYLVFVKTSILNEVLAKHPPPPNAHPYYPHRSRMLRRYVKTALEVRTTPQEPCIQTKQPLVTMLLIPFAYSKVQPGTCHEGPEEEHRYSSTLSLTSALDGVGGQRHIPAALLPGKIRYPLYRRLGRPQGRSGEMRKISPPTRIRSLDRPGRSESLYRPRYPGPRYLSLTRSNECVTDTGGTNTM
jgi:hypothetical protein